MALAGYLDFPSISTPTSPASGVVRLYAGTRAGSTIDALAYRTALGIEIVVGRDLYVQVRNVSGATIAAGQVVYISGSSASIARIELAQADSTMTKLPALGITAAAIANNSNGVIMTRGVLTMDTSGWSAGDTLYLSATTPGALTNVAPTHPNVEQAIGVVEFVNASTGLVMMSLAPINLHRIDGTNMPSFAIGDATGTTKSLLFKKASSVIGTLQWNPSASRTITLPDVTGTVLLDTGVVPAASGGTGVNNGSNNLTVPATGTAALLATANVFSAAQSVTIADSGTTNQPGTLVVGHNSSGTAAAGFGSDVTWQLQTTAAVDVPAAFIRTTWVDATNATRKARARYFVYDTTNRECLRLEASGSAPMVGFLGAAAVVRPSVNAACTDLATAIALANTIRTALINLGLAA
jgi:hypothetical protein